MPWTLFETAIGRCGVAWTDAGIAWLQLPEATRARTQARLLEKADARGVRATSRTTPAWIADAIARTCAHLKGQPQDFTAVPLALPGASAFATKVYRALQAVPAGSTITYGELARAVGSPGGSRAVGRAMATNPVPILVPCHRVLASKGKAGGFSAYGGIETKARILAIEGFAPKDARDDRPRSASK